jgi:hypothetical protein
MIRAASRTLTRSARRVGAVIVPNRSPYVSFSKSSLSSLTFNEKKRIPVPEPALALAYDYEDDGEADSHDPNEVVRQECLSSTHSKSVEMTAASGPRTPSSSPYPPPSNYDQGKVIPRGKSGTGGGGGGRHRCPKCGAQVTFRHGDFEENTFYCAACSGWFVSNTKITAKDDPYDELMDKQQIHAKRIHEDPQMVMQHIPKPPEPHEAHPPQSHAPLMKKIPTPKEIMTGLNEYVIGQRNVKVALSVGVYNHFKRIFVAEAQAAAQQRKQAEMEEGAFMASANSIPINQLHDGPSLAEMNLGQFSSSSVSPMMENRTEGHSFNSINNPKFARDVEDVEIDKSNILVRSPALCLIL